MNIAQAKRIIENIMEDIEGRAVIGDEWENISDDVKEEIKGEWLKIIMCS